MSNEQAIRVREAASEDDADDLRRAASLAAERTTSGVSTEALPPSGFGARLSWERQRAGLDISDVAARLRLHPNQVRAIEQEDFARLPEAAYVRGFVRSYARVLNVDASAILADLSAKLDPPPESVVDAMTTTGDYSPVRAAAHERLSRHLVMGVAVVGLIAMGIIGWQSSRWAETAPAPQLTAAPPLQSVPATPVALPVDEPPAVKTEESKVSPSDADEEANVPAAAANAPVPMLALRFTGPSWVEVTDASGKILLSKLSPPGTEHSLNGQPPLTVVIGDANMTSVSVHGEAFDLQPFTRNNVARFTVKAQ